MWSMPLRVSCSGPLLCLACLGGGGPVEVPPYLALGCGGGGRASPGGMPSTVARGVWGQALPLPRLPAHWAGCWGPLSTCCGRGLVGVGAQHCHLGLHALWGLPAAGRVRSVHVPWGRLGGGGVRRARRFCGRGGAVGGGSLCLVPSLCLPWPGNKAGVTGVVLSMGGVAPHTTPVRARPPSLGAICAASWRVGASSLVLRGSCGSRRLGRGKGRAPAPLSGRRRGDHPPCLGGWGPGPPRLAGREGGWGGVAPRPPCSPSGCRPAVPHPGPPRAVGALPSGVRVRSGSRSRPGVGGDEGRPVDRSPGGPCRPEPPPALSE